MQFALADSQNAFGVLVIVNLCQTGTGHQPLPENYRKDSLSNIAGLREKSCKIENRCGGG